VQALTEGLLALDRNADDLAAIEPLMRAAHSLKGAAHIVDLHDVEQLAHAMEDCFVAAQKGRLRLNKQRIDRLLAGIDLISRISSLDEKTAHGWLEANRLAIGEVLIGAIRTGRRSTCSFIASPNIGKRRPSACCSQAWGGTAQAACWR